MNLRDIANRKWELLELLYNLKGNREAAANKLEWSATDTAQGCAFLVTDGCIERIGDGWYRITDWGRYMLRKHCNRKDIYPCASCYDMSYQELRAHG